MHSDIEAQPARTPIVKRAAAGLVLVALAALAIHFVIGLIMTIFWIVVAVAAVLAVIWALKTI
jgi:fatty acid desaturase